MMPFLIWEIMRDLFLKKTMNESSEKEVRTAESCRIGDYFSTVSLLDGVVSAPHVDKNNYGMTAVFNVKCQSENYLGLTELCTASGKVAHFVQFEGSMLFLPSQTLAHHLLPSQWDSERVALVIYSHYDLDVANHGRDRLQKSRAAAVNRYRADCERFRVFLNSERRKMNVTDNKDRTRFRQTVVTNAESLLRKLDREKNAAKRKSTQKKKRLLQFRSFWQESEPNPLCWQFLVHKPKPKNKKFKEVNTADNLVADLFPQQDSMNLTGDCAAAGEELNSSFELEPDAHKTGSPTQNSEGGANHVGENSPHIGIGEARGRGRGRGRGRCRGSGSRSRPGCSISSGDTNSDSYPSRNLSSLYRGRGRGKRGCGKRSQPNSEFLEHDCNSFADVTEFPETEAKESSVFPEKFKRKGKKSNCKKRKLETNNDPDWKPNKRQK